MSQRKRTDEIVTVAWREPAAPVGFLTYNSSNTSDPAPGPVHALTMRDFRVTPVGAFCRAETLCGVVPREGAPIHSVAEDITCAPCLAALGGGAVDMAERLLAGAREPVAA